MGFVPIKTDDQLDLQALHRVRDRRVHRRTAIINQIRGFLLERGITFAKGPANLRNQMPAMLEDAELKISPRMRTLLARVWQEWKQLEIDIADASDEIERISSEDEGCKRRNRTFGLDGHGCSHWQRRRKGSDRMPKVASFLNPLGRQRGLNALNFWPMHVLHGLSDVYLRATTTVRPRRTKKAPASNQPAHSSNGVRAGSTGLSLVDVTS